MAVPTGSGRKSGRRHPRAQRIHFVSEQSELNRRHDCSPDTTLTGQGLIIKLKPKSKAGWRIIELPSWTVALLKRRQREQEPNEWQAVFTSPLGHLRDPGNTQADLRDVFGRIGYSDVTSHTFRRTVATLMGEADLLESVDRPDDVQNENHG